MGTRRVIKVGTSLLRGSPERGTEAVIGDLATSLCGLWQRQQPVVQDVMPSTHEAVGLDLGLGYAQGGGAAFDVAGSGTLAGYRVTVYRRQADGRWLLARDAQGALLGFAYAGQYNARAGYLYSCENSIYLRHDMLGQGIGSRLLAALLEACEACGFRQVVAGIERSGDGEAEILGRGEERVTHAALGAVDEDAWGGHGISVGRGQGPSPVHP